MFMFANRSTTSFFVAVHGIPSTRITCNGSHLNGWLNDCASEECLTKIHKIQKRKEYEMVFYGRAVHLNMLRTTNSLNPHPTCPIDWFDNLSSILTASLWCLYRNMFEIVLANFGTL